MNNSLAIPTLLLFMYGIIILWKVSFIMLESERIKPFLPFFAYGAIFNTLAAFVYYQLSFTSWWIALDIAVFLCHIGILVSLVKIINKNNVELKQ